ncbi:general secretion pathway protein GspB [Psychromonas hadalis]|uniref:general secretion pathway protein GspB n=1 Tax=Psychromonas hadalis TaxID=211669 RepID=UPI0003B3FD52|nr:general secretion pathway protein GspB [Psychromonas hadalis]
MSTILQALQKNKFDQAGGPPPVIQQENRLLNWKIAIFFALFIIIVLLITLIYLLLNPRHQQQSPISASSAITQSQPSLPLVKVTFETKPLPTAPPKPIKVTPVKVVTAPKKIAPQKILVENDKKQQQTVNYGETSSDLKKRFELALLLSDIEKDDEIEDDFTHEEDINDGSDIHDMSNNFQDKVPLIRYDSHMYSSVVADRWIRINGETLKEGEFDETGQLELIEVQPQRSVFRLGRQSFTLESLVDWKGY